MGLLLADADHLTDFDNWVRYVFNFFYFFDWLFNELAIKILKFFVFVINFTRWHFKLKQALKRHLFLDFLF